MRKYTDLFNLHAVNRPKGTIPPADCYKLVIKFPTNPKLDFAVKPADDSLRKRVPATDKKLSSLVISLKDYPDVDGFGMPFANRGHPSEGVVNNGEYIGENVTLMDMIRRLEFHFIVASPDMPLFSQLFAGIPTPFRYPYGEEHFWDEGRYDEMLPKTKGHQFKPSWSFDNDNEHLAALTQSQVQDVMWIHKASKKFGDTKLRAYFISSLSCPPADCSVFHAIVPLDKVFFQFEDSWRALIKSGYLKLCIYDNEEDEKPVKWEARVQEAPKTLDILKVHCVEKSDLVLQVRKPKSPQQAGVKIFGNRRAANLALNKNQDNWSCVSIEFDVLLKDYIRKVDAVNSFHPQAQPTNPVACGLGRAAEANSRLPIPPTLQFKMSLHRDMLRGRGFWKTLMSGAINRSRIQLPVVNLIDIPRDLLDALFKEVLA